MLNLLELTATELGMIKLMADFFADKPELTAKTESFSSANYAVAIAFSENFGVAVENAMKIIESLESKIDEAEYVQMETLDIAGKVVSLSKSEMNMLKVLIDYFSESPKMAQVSILADRKEALIDAFHWFFGGNIEDAREIFENLIDEIQKSVSIEIETGTFAQSC